MKDKAEKTDMDKAMDRLDQACLARATKQVARILADREVDRAKQDYTRAKSEESDATDEVSAARLALRSMLEAATGAVPVGLPARLG